MAKVLKSAVLEWELMSNNHHGLAVVTDNAQNMDVAVRKTGLSPHMKCFADFKPCIASGFARSPL